METGEVEGLEEEVGSREPDEVLQSHCVRLTALRKIAPVSGAVLPRSRNVPTEKARAAAQSRWRNMSVTSRTHEHVRGSTRMVCEV